MKEVDRFFGKLRLRLSDKTPLLKAAYTIAGHKDIVDHFEREEGPQGRWAPLKEGTQRHREGKIPKRSAKQIAGIEKRTGKKFVGGVKILQDTGRLFNSILPTNVKKVNDDTIMAFANVNYSAVHDRGSKKKNIPQRKFMWFTRAGLELMRKIIVDGLLK